MLNFITHIKFIKTLVIIYFTIIIIIIYNYN